MHPLRPPVLLCPPEDPPPSSTASAPAPPSSTPPPAEPSPTTIPLGRLEITVTTADVSAKSSKGPLDVITEVFSPGLRTPLKAAVDAAGQACRESSATSSAAPRNRLPPEALDARPTLGADLQRCPSCPSLDGESW